VGNRAVLDRMKRELVGMRRDPIAENAAPVWTAFPGPQTDAEQCLADELYFGGQAGGGKTGLLVGLALTRHQRTLLLRRDSTQLKEISDQLKQFGGSTGWRGLGAYGGTLRYRGRVIEAAGCKDEKNKEDYKGRPHDLIGFDEIGDFLESQYVFISGWNRTSIPGQRCRVVATGNPPTRGSGEWVIRRWAPWVDPTASKQSKPGELRWYSTVDGKEEEFPDGTPFEWKRYTITPQSRTFIPAALADNPILIRTNYASKLAAMPDALRRAYLEGDFTVCLSDDPWQVIPTAWIRAAQERWKAKGWKDAPPDVPLTASGLDVAYGGSDRTVLARRYGDWIAPLNVWPGDKTQDGRQTMLYVQPLVRDSKAPVNCDVIGYGAAAYEQIRDAGMRTRPVNFGAGADNGKDARRVLDFANMRAFAYWQLRDALDPDLDATLCLPDDPELLAELACAKYEPRGGRIYIQPKEEIAQELGRSPDKADAVVLANMQPAGVNFYFEVIKTQPRSESDFSSRMRAWR